MKSILQGRSGFTMRQFWIALRRSLLLRCPRCGEGKLFRHRYSFKMYDYCPVCHLIYEREEGFYTGAMALNLIFSELLVTVYVLPVSIWAGVDPHVPSIPLLLLGSPLPILLPVLFFRHSRGLWINMNYLFNPHSLEHKEHDEDRFQGDSLHAREA